VPNSRPDKQADSNLLLGVARREDDFPEEAYESINVRFRVESFSLHDVPDAASIRACTSGAAQCGVPRLTWSDKWQRRGIHSQT
jgi:hypothetical protein